MEILLGNKNKMFGFFFLQEERLRESTHPAEHEHILFETAEI